MHLLHETLHKKYTKERQREREKKKTHTNKTEYMMELNKRDTKEHFDNETFIKYKLNRFLALVRLLMVPFLVWIRCETPRLRHMARSSIILSIFITDANRPLRLFFCFAKKFLLHTQNSFVWRERDGWTIHFSLQTNQIFTQLTIIYTDGGK